MKNNPRKFLADIINSISPSGYEGGAAEVWKKEARGFTDFVETDVHGNTHAVVNKGGKVKVMLAGHCDEIGFLVTNIDDKGFLWISEIGGWDPQIVQGQRVVIKGRKGLVRGVMGKTPVHYQKPDERKKVYEVSDIWVDIGARKQKDAEALVAIGDPLVVDHDYLEITNNRAVGRGFDDRAGAVAVLEAARILKNMDISAEVHAVATVQEEIGLRGAKTAAFKIDPVAGIAVDVTGATDHPNVGGGINQRGKIEIGKGPVITRGPNINPILFKLIVETARKKKIPIQIVAEPRGTGTDANIMQLSKSGIATALISIPLRYLHSPCELLSLEDLDNVGKLLAYAVAAIDEKTNFIPF
jgi:tetrahedral aminopeptidase